MSQLVTPSNNTGHRFQFYTKNTIDLMVAELHHYAELVTYLRSSPHPHKELVLPLYLDGGKFVNPYCCYGNDVDCDLCGAWVVFHLAAKIEEAGKFGSEFRGRLT